MKLKCIQHTIKLLFSLRQIKIDASETLFYKKRGTHNPFPYVITVLKVYHITFKQFLELTPSLDQHQDYVKRQLTLQCLDR